MNYKLNGMGLPGVLTRLGKMTALRETYLVEQSLLRTLGPLLGVLKTSLYRVDDMGEVVRALHHERSISRTSDGLQRVSEHVEEVSRGNDIPELVERLLESVQLLAKPCSRQNGGSLTICYPIIGGGQICGYFVFERDHEASPAESAVIVGVLEVFTNYFAALETSQRDKLTGLLNRYSLELNLDRLWTLLSTRIPDNSHSSTYPARRTRVPQNYWLAIFDIDNFKQINDTFGHLLGDEVLIVVTRILEKAFRTSDLLYRYGGEEFISIIAADDLDEAEDAFERARSMVEDFSFPQVGRVTISGGFAEADAIVLPQEIINRADRALYEAKRRGRNCVLDFGSLLKDGAIQEVSTGTVDLW